MIPTFLEFCVAVFFKELDLFPLKELEFWAILTEMQYLTLTLLQEEFLE